MASSAATYRYIFTQPPARHGQDLAYTFWNGPGTNVAVQNEGLAAAMQEYFTDFMVAGTPNLGNAGGLLEWPKWKVGAEKVVEFGGQGVRIAPAGDELKNRRCEFWEGVKVF